jgi:hypothetical protein
MAYLAPPGFGQPQNRDNPPDQRPVFLAGFAVILVGTLCLCLSGMVAATGSWAQATLDAFGVGFIVGGLVDVLALSWLNEREKQKQREFSGQAKFILGQEQDPDAKPMAWDLLTRAGPYIDPKLHEQLLDFIERAPQRMPGGGETQPGKP